MLHKAWNSKGEVPYCFPRSSIKFQGHTGQNITNFDPNWAFPDYRPVAAFKSLRFALLCTLSEMTNKTCTKKKCNALCTWNWRHYQNLSRAGEIRQCLMIVLLSSFVIHCAVQEVKKVCTVVTNYLCANSSVAFVYSPRCFASQVINTIITLPWAHKPLARYYIHKSRHISTNFHFTFIYNECIRKTETFDNDSSTVSTDRFTRLK